MNVCLVCGIQHEARIGDDVFQVYLRASSALLLRNLRKMIDISQIPSPICNECVCEFRRFMDMRGPLLAAEFAQHVLSSRAKSFNTREGLRRAKEAGKRLGRPPKYDDQLVQKIMRMREEGKSYAYIAWANGISQKSTVHKIVGMQLRKARNGLIATKES